RPTKIVDQRRSTLSSLVSSSIQAFDQSGGSATPMSYMKKKTRKTPGVIGLPDTPVALHDLNLDELVPRYAPPVSPTGKLKVQLQFTDDKHAITVIIIEAQNLVIPGIPKDVDVNPYVKAFLVPGRTVKYRTKTFSKTKNPLFLEKFCIKDLVPSEINEDSAIEFQVYSSHHVSRRHLVGVGSVRLMDVENLCNGQVDLILYPQTVYRLHQGDLRISGCYQPVAGKIVFNVLEARNLPRVSLLGAINPYVKVEMYVNGIREAKHKTKVRQNTQDPVWHHQCVFDINRENPKLLGHVFVFHVLHKDMMTGVHKIGQVDLGWYSHGEQLEHWYEIMEHPHRAADYWHPIIKTNKITS
ncbi:synaptotagmin 21, partial [Lottia gigantea]